MTSLYVRGQIWENKIKQQSVLTLEIPTLRADEPIYNEAWRKMLPQFLHNPISYTMRFKEPS